MTLSNYPLVSEIAQGCHIAQLLKHSLLLQVATNEDQTMGRGAGSIEVKKLSTIMQELGHEWVDVLKIDIEGHEWPVLEGMIADKTPFPFTQMQVSVDARIHGIICMPCTLVAHLHDRLLAPKGVAKRIEFSLISILGYAWSLVRCGYVKWQAVLQCD